MKSVLIIGKKDLLTFIGKFDISRIYTRKIKIMKPELHQL